ncbi:MAG: serine/threonine protein kinase, partial [Myxococcales bacterium]|nr:serine/threonine protein kinase [Myxococcales bacterium]
RTVYAHNPDLRRRLRREAEVARHVRHPGVVPVLDEGVLTDGSPYIVMEKIAGVSLARLLLRLGHLPADETAAIAIRVASILHAAHAAGYVHRDVKPEHVILCEGDGGGLAVWLLDFGVCASDGAPLEEKKRENGRVFGTPTYCSPEQAAGIPEVDGRADLFGLGITMFECLTGRVPFTGIDVNDLLRAIIRCQSPSVGDLMPDLRGPMDSVVLRTMARLPTDRYASARAMARALVPLAGDRAETERRIVQKLGLRVATPIAETATTTERPAPRIVAA